MKKAFLCYADQITQKEIENILQKNIEIGNN